MAGISAGFASVFGTPLAGALFGLEVLAIGRLRYEAMLPCLAAAVIADQVGLLWGQLFNIQHTHYAVPLIPALSAWTLSAMVIAGMLFGVTGKLFAQATHGLSALMKRWISYAPLRPLIGGLVVALAVWLLGTDRYIGLGIPTIVDALQEPLPAWDFLGKMAFTVVSLGTGFKGGEVTPLFFIGATLGNALGPLLHQPVALLAAIGLRRRVCGRGQHADRLDPDGHGTVRRGDRRVRGHRLRRGLPVFRPRRHLPGAAQRPCQTPSCQGS